MLAAVPDWIDVGMEVHGPSLRSSGSDAVLKTIASVISQSHDVNTVWLRDAFTDYLLTLQITTLLTSVIPCVTSADVALFDYPQETCPRKPDCAPIRCNAPLPDFR